MNSRPPPGEVTHTHVEQRFTCMHCVKHHHAVHASSRAGIHCGSGTRVVWPVMEVVVGGLVTVVCQPCLPYRLPPCNNARGVRHIALLRAPVLPPGR